MSRRAGLAALAVAIVLVFSLVFTRFDKPVNSWTPTDDGDLQQLVIECPSPWSIVVGDAELEMEPAWHGERCVPSARLLFLEGVVVLAGGLALGAWGIKAGPRSRPRSIRTMKTAGNRFPRE